MERIIYKKNPLVEVVCQVNYPAILSIESLEPTKFQELIREKYPQYQIGNEFADEIAVNFNGNNAETQIQRHAVTKIHNFIAQDNNMKIVFAKNRISFSVSKYKEWEIFYKDFMEILNKFDEIYHPTYYNRIGLRYINIIDRENLNICLDWNQLIMPQLLGFNSIHNTKYNVKSTIVQSEIEYNNMNARILSGTVVNSISKKQCYKIDCDYYKSGNFEKSNISSEFNALHSNFQNFFNDSITEELKKILNQ